MTGLHGLEIQDGFSPGRGTRDASWSLRFVLHRRKEFGLGTWAAFLDLVKAYDSVDRGRQVADAELPTVVAAVKLQAAWRRHTGRHLPDGGVLALVLLKLGIPPKLVRLVLAMLHGFTAQVKVGQAVRTFLIDMGLAQGSNLSPVLFLYVMQGVMEAADAEFKFGSIFMLTIDDGVALGRWVRTPGGS